MNNLAYDKICDNEFNMSILQESSTQIFNRSTEVIRTAAIKGYNYLNLFHKMATFKNVS